MKMRNDAASFFIIGLAVIVSQALAGGHPSDLGLGHISHIHNHNHHRGGLNSAFNSVPEAIYENLLRRQDVSTPNTAPPPSGISSPPASSSSTTSPSPITSAPVQSPDASSNRTIASSAATGIIDPQVWSAETQRLCTTWLSTLKGVASNPSGIAVCYNIPALDVKSGTFQAELRMYNISAPKDEWVGLQLSSMTVRLAYSGATAQLVDTNGLTKRSTQPNRLERRQQGKAPRPQQLKELLYVAEINKDKNSSKLVDSALQTLLMPDIVLSATNAAGITISTKLSSTEASFLNGVFSQKVQQSINAPSAPAAQAQKTGLESIPGVEFGIFPVSLIITLSWTGILVIAVGWGTFTRMKFREVYRRRIIRANNMNCPAPYHSET